MSSLKDKTLLIPSNSVANPARRIGTADDIAGTAPMALTIDRRSDDVGSAPGGQAGP